MPRRQKPPRLYHREDEGMWIIIDAGKQTRTGCRHEEREEANEIFREYLNSKAEGRVAKVAPSKITLGEILARYADDIGPDHQDPARTAYAITALAPFWGNLKSSDVSVDLTRKYGTYRNKSPWTIRRELGVLQAALNHAVIALHLPNPPKLLLPKKPVPRTRWLTQTEATELQKFSPPHLRRFLMISLLTGRRKSSVLKLCWEPSPKNGWIDLERGMIHFKGTHESESTKRRGTITMPKSLLDAASQWNLDGNASVIHYHGKPVADIDTSFERACTNAKLEGVVPHTLKHTAVTWAFQNGMSVEDASDYFATSVTTLTDVYRQHSPTHQHRAVKVMDKFGIDFVANNVADNQITAGQII